LEKHHADYMFGLFLPYGQTRMAAPDHAVENFVQRSGGLYRYYVVAWNHNFAHRQIFEIEDSVDHVFLQFWKIARKAAGADDELEFLSGVTAAALAAFDAEQARNARRGALNYSHEDGSQTVENHQSGGHDHGETVRF